MSTQKAKFQLFARLQALGFTYDEAAQLRRIEMTLHRWDEMECGDSNNRYSIGIERDEASGKPYRVISWHDRPVSETKRYPIADREAGALRRLAAIMARHPDYVAYHQGDCRGRSLYIVAKASLIQDGKELPIDSYYNRGLCVAA